MGIAAKYIIPPLTAEEHKNLLKCIQDSIKREIAFGLLGDFGKKIEFEMLLDKISRPTIKQ